MTEGHVQRRRFAGRNVVVTGASSGIGQAIAIAFAEEGAHIVAVGRDETRLLATRSMAPDPAAVTLMVLDVSDPVAVETRVRSVAEERGQIHVLVNCAGIAPMTGVMDILPEQWQRVIGTNLSGVFYMSQAAARNMIKHGGGVIINVSSCNSFVVESPYADYNASKAGVNLLTQSMAFELAHLGVRCVAVAPGMTMTPMMDFAGNQETYDSYLEKIPLRRPATPRDQANMVLFLASDDAAYVTGVTIRVDGGIMQGFWADPRMSPPIPASEGR